MALRNVVVCFGDSLTYGSRDIVEGRGYPAMLVDLIEQETQQICVCINKGITRETSTDILRRAYDVLRAYPESNLALILAGTNDLKGTPNPIVYKENIKQIVNIARVCGKRVLVGKLPPIQSMGMWCFPKDANKGVALYNDILETLSKEMDFPLVDFSDMGDYLCDGVHFGPEGYELMAKKWFEGIKELI